MLRFALQNASLMSFKSNLTAGSEAVFCHQKPSVAHRYTFIHRISFNAPEFGAWASKPAFPLQLSSLHIQVLI